MATVNTSGYINKYTAMRWLEDCFDPSTRRRAGGSQRVLFLDGHDSHVQVEFLEACWRRTLCVWSFQPI